MPLITGPDDRVSILIVVLTAITPLPPKPDPENGGRVWTLGRKYREGRALEGSSICEPSSPTYFERPLGTGDLVRSVDHKKVIIVQ